MAARSHIRNQSWLSRVGWLVLLWLASVAALGVAALVFRAIMSAAGTAV
jgi:hypothetical protein